MSATYAGGSARSAPPQLVTEGRAAAPAACRVPAIEAEQVVTDRIRALLGDGTAVFDAVGASSITTEPRGELVAQAAKLSGRWSELASHERRRIITTLNTRIEVGDECVVLHVVPTRLTAILQPNAIHATHEIGRDDETVILTVPTQLQRIGKGNQLIVHGGAVGTAKPNAPLIRLLARAHQLQHQLLQASKPRIESLAASANLNGRYATLLLRLSWLAPDITQAILQGHQPRSLTADELSRVARIPIDWQAQRGALGLS